MWFRTIAAAGAGALLTFAGWATVVHASASSGLSSCAGLNIPANSASHTTLDQEKKQLTIEYTDSSKAEREVTIAYSRGDCNANPSVKVEIDRAVAVGNQLHADQCSSTKDFLASGQTTLRGQVINLAAAKQFVAAEC
jgi:hypothetical protein